MEGPKELSQQQIDAFVHELRSLGLYEPMVRRLSAREMHDESDELSVAFADPDSASVREILIIDLMVGDLAFAPRVQAPEQAAFDAQFDAMASRFGADEYDATRAEIADKLARGINPFDAEDDNDNADD